MSKCCPKSGPKAGVYKYTMFLSAVVYQSLLVVYTIGCDHGSVTDQTLADLTFTQTEISRYIGFGSGNCEITGNSRGRLATAAHYLSGGLFSVRRPC